MPTLNSLPRRMLCLVHFRFLIGKPADGSRIEQKLRAAQRSQSCCFRKPLVPADEGADLAVRSVVTLETKIAGSEIEFFVIQRVVRDVHLAILTGYLPRGVDHDRSVVIDAGRAFFKERGDDHDFSLPGDFAQSLCRWTRNSFGEFEKPDIFRLTKVL